MNNLDYLLNHTYHQIIDAATQIESLRVAQSQCAVKLASMLELTVLILSVKYGMEDEMKEFIRCSLNLELNTIIQLDGYQDNCWEDVTNATISYMIKNQLGKQ